MTQLAASWLSEFRARGRARFEELGFPTVRQEEWRFTNPAPLAGGDFEHVSATDALEIVCGTTLPAGAIATSLERAIELQPERVEAALGRASSAFEQPLAALNAAHARGGVFVHVPAGVSVEGPVHVRPNRAQAQTQAQARPGGGDGSGTGNGSARPRASHTRALVVLEPGAKLVYVEDRRATATAPAWTNPVTEILLGEGAEIEHVVVLGERADGLHTGATFVRQAARSRFRGRVIALGAKLGRQDTRVLLEGEGAHTELDGLYVVSGSELVDHHTVVDHAAPGCTSREFYKGVLDGSGRAVFNGAVVIRPHAQKSDAGQSNMNLLLSTDATIDTKPELQIWADDVKCGHGATVGQLDDAQLFYLRARGLGEAEARAILVHAFAREIVERIGPQALRADVDALVRERMESLAARNGGAS
jgi:Fe-S cluster assembly protein SufD